VKVFVAGSYSSALASRYPLAIRTLPPGGKVAVCPPRGVVISPVAVNVPGDCAIAIGARLAVPGRIRKTKPGWRVVTNF
jgi:hypothetical protein